MIRTAFSISTSVLAFAFSLSASGEVVPGGPLVWEETYPTALRGSQSFATDPATGRLTMFGGTTPFFSSASSSFQFGDLWEWDGTTWHPIQSSGPQARGDAASAFDPTSGRLMLFGGAGTSPDFSVPGFSPQVRSDTWEWDGHRWSQRACEGPAAFGVGIVPSLVYNPARSSMMLNVLGTTRTQESAWEWDGKAWNLLSTGGTGYYRTNIVFDAGVGRVVSLRTTTDLGGLRTQEWTGSQWVDAAEPDPQWVELRALLGDVTTGTVYFVGSTSTTPRGLWQRVAGVWTRLSDVAQPPYPGVSFTWDSINNTVLTMGSFSPNIYSHNTYLLRNGVWSPTCTLGAGPRINPAVAFDRDRKTTVVYGSAFARNSPDIPTAARGETWEYDGTDWILKSTNSDPRPPSMVVRSYFDTAQHVTVTPILNRSIPVVWEWNGSVWAERVTNTMPQRRLGVAFAYHETLGAAVFFGGRATSTDPAITNSTWLLDGGQWTELTIPGPSPRSDSFMAYDELRKKIVLFSGHEPNVIPGISDTWEFDGKSWTQVAVGASPPTFVDGSQYPLFFTGMTYDPIRRRTVLLQDPVLPGAGVFPGPLPSAAPGVIWEWDGTVWTRRVPSQPVRPTAMANPAVMFWFGLNHPLRRLAFTPGFTTDGTFSYDPISQRCLLWGGQNLVMDAFFGPISIVPPSLRELPASAVIASPCANITVIAGRSVQIEGRIAMENATYHWTKDGTDLPPSSRLLGERTESIVIRDARRGDAGQYTLIAQSPGGEVLATLPCKIEVRSPVDFNADGSVDTMDLARFLGAFGQAAPNCASRTQDLPLGCLEDLNADGTINTKDLIRFLGEMARWNSPALQE